VTSAGILYPGEMGCAVARLLAADGWDLCTYLDGPSLACRGDAGAARIADLESLAAVVDASDVLISLVPPAAARDVAQQVARAAAGVAGRPLYLEGNSVAPATVAAVAATLAGAGLDCVDGAFVGSAAELGGRTRLYLSGPGAAALAEALPAALNAHALGAERGEASALKLAFAGFNKGLVALFLEVMAAGREAGAADELLACLTAFYPGTVETLERLVPTYPRHAARRADELDELAAWLQDRGRDAAWAAAARDALARLAALRLDADRDWTLAEVLLAAVPADQAAGHREP
jgi:3-hydroxyisobutyrate dehydrogenase-like beta-hydroxyacid dehydrogenase